MKSAFIGIMLAALVVDFVLRLREDDKDGLPAVIVNGALITFGVAALLA